MENASMFPWVVGDPHLSLVDRIFVFSRSTARLIASILIDASSHAVISEPMRPTCFVLETLADLSHSTAFQHEASGDVAKCLELPCGNPVIHFPYDRS